jgi:taurine dioxygenase
MRARLINNSWPVEITDFDFNTATQHDIDLLGCLTNYYTLVLVKHQKNALSIPVQEKVCKQFGSTLLDRVDAETFKNIAKHLKHQEGEMTLRVTGEPDQDGNPGLFGFDHELIWHANKVEQPHRRSMVWLYGERGTAGSVTEFTNHILAYQDLESSLKEQIKDLKINYKGTFPYVSPKYDYGKTSAGWHTPPVVYTNVGGQTGIHLSWLEVDYFENHDPEESRIITEQLRDHILGNPKYRYEHHWQDGDVLLMEQWLGVHRRPAFDGMKTRVLDRIETNFDHIDFSKMQEALNLITS